MRKLFIFMLFAAFLIMPASAVGTLVGNWTLDDATGTTANDTSGFNNNGTIYNSTWTYDYINGRALYLNGAYSYINVGGDSELNASTEFTFSAWINTNSSKALQFIGGHGSTGFIGWYMVIENGNILRLSAGNGSASSSLSRVFTNNKWNHIAGSFNGTHLTTYINSIPASSTISFTGNVNYSGVTNMTIGAIEGAGITAARYFDGNIDEVKFWNYSLTQSEITTEFQRFHPVLAYPTGAITISATYPPQTTSVNFSWYDDIFSGDRIQVALDSNFNVLVVDTTISSDFYTATLESGDTYYWKVRQYNSTNNSYGSTTKTENFSITSASSATGQGVQGVVYEIINGLITPIDEAQVYIYNSTFSDFMITGSNGYYIFDGLGNDTYQVYAVKQDYDTTAALPVNVNGSLATQDILMKKFISPYIPNFVYEKFIVRGLFDNAYTGVTVNVYVGDELTVSQTGTTDSAGQVVFRLFKDQKYRVTFSGGGIGSDIEVTIYAKEESYLVRIMSGFPTGGDRNTDITSNLTSIAINSTWSNLSLIYNDARNSTSIVWLYVRNLSTNTTCYVSSTSNNITMGCPVIASGKYQFGFNATSSVYGFFKQDKIINFDVGKPSTPAIVTNVNSTLLQWASIIIIVLTAALFSVKTVKFGAVIVPLEALVFWAFGWFEPIPGNSIQSFVLLGCAVSLGVMVYLRQSESKAVYQ